MLTSPPGSPLRGALKPRVEHHPEYVFSYGAEAAELMKRAGRPLDAWQVDAVTLMTAVRGDGKWACFECCEWVSRQNGKGAILEARALAGFLLLGEELIMWSAHEYKTAMEAFRRVKAIVRALGIKVKENDDNLWLVDGILVKFQNTNGEEALERLDTGARIKFIARSAGSGRGFSGDLNIIDEAFAYTAEQHAALLYTVSARPNPQFIYTSSPPLKGDSGEIMYELRRRGDRTAPRKRPWQQDPSLAYRDWGLAGELEDLDGVDVDDLANAAATNPALGAPRPSGITLETIERELRSDRLGYPRERLGIWPREIRKSQNGPISDELWRDQICQVRERPTDVALAVQVSYRRTHTAIVAVGARSGGGLLTSIVDYRRHGPWVVDRVAELKAKYNPIAIAVQDKGPTGSLLEEMAKVGLLPSEDRERPMRGDLAIPWSDDVADAYGLYVDAANERRLWHLDEAPLNVALTTAQTRPLSGGTAWDYRDDAAAPLIGSTLALWAYVTRVDLVNSDYDVLDSVA